MHYAFDSIHEVGLAFRHTGVEGFYVGFLNPYRIRWGDAERHLIDMRLLGQSLQGADKITSDGLIFLIQGRLAKRGERAPVIIKSREPLQGSVVVQGTYETAVALLPLGAPIAADLASGFLKEWWLAIKARFSGNRAVVEVAINTMAEMARDQLAARDTAEQRAHERDMSHLDMIRHAIGMQQRPMESFAAPIGPSVAEGRIINSDGEPVVVNTAEADQIRESGKVMWSELKEIPLRTEGFRFHTNGLSIDNPKGDGYLMARVRDPRFEELENPYTNAAQRKSEIVVLARSGYKDGELVNIDTVDFIRENTA